MEMLNAGKRSLDDSQREPRTKRPGHRTTRVAACTARGLSSGVLLALAAVCAQAPAQAEPVDVGFRDFYYGVIVNSTPTGEKPESKLWFNDGIWWATMWDSLAGRYEIHRFHPETQSWSTTGTPIDDRHSTKGDALWDGQRLYVVSHVFTKTAGPTVPVNSGRLYRYSYNAGTDSYTLDPGFPVEVNSSKSETLVLEKDSTGRLWITWMEAGRVKINCSLGSDAVWGVPFDLPPQESDASSDDVSSIIAFGGNRIGIIWSNQLGHDNRFSVHNDGDPIGTWQPAELVSIDPSNGDLSDDHINIKTHAGHVYALTKTNETEPTAPLVILNHRNPAGTWTIHVVGIKSENHTRAVLALAPETDMVHVLATCAIEGRNRIFRKSTRLSTLVFPSGRGELFIDSPADLKVGNVSTSKHNVSNATGLLAIASDQDTRHYFHNFYATLPTTSVEARGGGADAPMTLGPAQPTPFRGSTRIPFALREPARIELAVFDVHGRRVRLLAADTRSSGHHAELWDGRNDSGEPVSTGIYFARLAGSGSATWQRLVRIR